MQNKYFIGKKIIEIDVVDSTNNYTANLLHKTKLVEGTVILAHFQSKGRGQRGELWHSEPGENLLFSIVLEPFFINNENYFLLSKVVALAINDVLEEISGKISFIKWPNDIYINEKKIAGILIENQWKGNTLQRAIVGIGININQLNFDKVENATSLSLLTAKTHNLHLVLEKINNKIEEYYLKLKMGNSKEIDQRYFEQLLYRNQWHTYLLNNGDKIKGKIVEIVSSGQMILEHENNSKKGYDIKEIKFMI